MSKDKNWYPNEVNSLLKDLGPKCSTLHINRSLLIYSIVKELMDLNEDHKKCGSRFTQILIESRMKELSSELQNYRVYDDRFKDSFDNGR